MISKAIDIIGTIICKLNEKNKPETMKYIGILADIVDKSMNDNDLWSTEELKKFNGLMKYVLLAIENSDIDFAVNILSKEIYPLFYSLILKTEGMSNDLSSKIDSTTDEIRNQYTEFMYPNIWKGVIPARLKEQVKESMCTAMYDLEYIQHIACRRFTPIDKLDVLVAGCGTGEAAIICALRYPEAGFTFVDISPASLKMAKRYIKDLEMTNAEVVQDDIMTMSLGKKFDIIISTGVIHHLSNPSMGVKNLKEHLKDNGVLSVMVYAEYGRFEVGLFQDALKLMLGNNIDFTKGIEHVKTIFNEVGKSNRIVNIAWKEDVMKGDQHIVDLLLNVNENRYNIENLCSMMENGGMKVLEFTQMSTLNPDSYVNGNKAKELFKRLSYLDRCKLAELINGRITKHNFYAVRIENESKKISAYDSNSDKYIVYRSPYLEEIFVKKSGCENLALRLDPVYFEEENTTQYIDLPIDRSVKMILDQCNGINKLGTIIQKLKGQIEPINIRNVIEKLMDYKMVFLHES